MENHDESSCPHIHALFSFTITVLHRNKGAEDFAKWFEAVFSRQHPNAKSDFALECKEEAEGPVLEIVQHNPMFTTDSLISLFEADRNKSEDAKFEQDAREV